MNKEQLIKNIASLADKWEGLTIEKQEDKVFEEYNELLEAKKLGDIEEIKKELADVIITMIVLDELKKFHHQKFGVYLNYLKRWVYLIDEINDEVIKNKMYDFHDSVSTYFIHSLNNTATQYNLNVWECLEYKYNIVAKREGKVINGTFVKN